VSIGQFLDELFRQLLCMHAAFFKNWGNGKWICNGPADMRGQTISATFSPMVSWCCRKPSQVPSTTVYLFTHFDRGNRQIREFSPYDPIFCHVSEFRCSGNVTRLHVVYRILQNHMRTQEDQHTATGLSVSSVSVITSRT